MDSVGLVVVSYNHAEYLPACLESIAQQTNLPDRVVLVDDQSSDACAELALQWAKSCPAGVNVETIITPRQGPSLAFNAGVAAAGTDLVAIIAADDLLLPNRLKRSAELLHEHNVELVVGRPRIIDEAGEPQSDSFAPEFFPQATQTSGTVFQNLVNHGNYLCAGTAMFRRTAFQKLGGFHPGLIQLQDYHLWIRWAQRSVHVTDERLISYRKSHRSLSSGSNSERMLAELRWVRTHSLDAASPAFLDDLIRPTMERGSAIPEDPKVKRALAFLSFSNPELRRIGYENVLDILSQPDGVTRLRSAGIEMQDVFQLTAGPDRSDESAGESFGSPDVVWTAARRLRARVIRSLGQRAP